MITNRRTETQLAPASQTTAHDLLSTLIAATDPDSSVRLTDKQLRDQAITILTAGHETTANAMTFTLYLLAKHPEVQRNLRMQIREALGAAPPSVPTLEKLPSIRHVLSESMRLLPPVWTLGRQNQRPVTLGKYTLPAKCTVLAAQWIVHRDKRWWPNPLAFHPARWQSPGHPRHAYFPFSTGPRNCIGEAFAWLEMSLALSSLLQHFEFSLPVDAPKELPLTPSITLRPKGPVRLTVRRL